MCICENVRSPGVEVADRCELPYGCWELNLAIDGSFGYFKDCYLSYIMLKIIVGKVQSRKIGHKTYRITNE